MIAKHTEITFTTTHEMSWKNITPEIKQVLQEWNVATGIVCIQVVGSTGSVVSIECEEQLLSHDLCEIYKRIAPPFSPGKSKHEAKWEDGNAHSHIRATLFGAQQSFNVVNGNLSLGQWQHIVFLEFDIQGRDRRVSIIFLGNQKD
jgi:secondary thiamine-phosphate synthase enzyme